MSDLISTPQNGSPETRNQVAEPLKPPRRVAIGRGASWIYEGFSLFNLGMGTSVAILLLAISIQIVGNLLPGVNLLLSLFSLVFAAGFMAVAHGGHTRQQLRFADYFAGFVKNMGELVLAAAIYMGLLFVIILVTVILAMIFGGWEILQLHMAAHFEGAISANEGLFLLFWALVALLFVIPLLMMVVYAPPLILFHDIKAWPAMTLSMEACWKNMLPLCWYGILVALLALLGIVPAVLPWVMSGIAPETLLQILWTGEWASLWGAIHMVFPSVVFGGALGVVVFLMVFPAINYANYCAYRDIFLYDDGGISV